MFRNVLIHVFILMACHPLYTQTFGPAVSINDIAFSTRYPSKIVSEDLNGDGFADLISSESEERKVFYYLNNGDGTFGQQIVVSSNLPEPIPVNVVDIDSDGDLDILTGSNVDNKYVYFENDGNGNFGREKIIVQFDEIFFRIDFIAGIGDLDMDNDIDLFIIASTGHKMYYLLNDGNENFDTKVLLTDTTWGPRYGAIADIDYDGDNDILYLLWDGNALAYLKNDGQGNFTEKGYINSEKSVVSGFKLFDINADGYLDIIGNYHFDSLSYLINDGYGNFHTEYVDVDITEKIRIRSLGDLNNDGFVDILFTDDYIYNDGENLYAIDGIGNDNYNPARIISDNTDKIGPSVAKDIDNDGDLDILTCSNTEDKLGYYINVGNGSFTNYNLINRDNFHRITTIANDIDNDGDLDLVAFSRQHDQIVWHANDGKGNFSAIRPISLDQVDGPNHIYLEDLDNDGRSDIVVAANYYEIYWIKNLGGGRFSNPHLLAIESARIDIILSKDLDDDGDKDIVIEVRRFPGDDILWLENLGEGNFSSLALLISSSEEIKAIDIADLNSDGKLDIIAGFNNGNSNSTGDIVWYKHFNGLSFTYEGEIGDSTYIINEVKVSDIDYDGDMDVIALGINNARDIKRISCFINDGANNFSARRYTQSTNQNISGSIANLSLQDINNDGFVDVISSDECEIQFNLNNGTGELLQSEVVVNAKYSNFLEAADLDGDSDLDIYFSTFYSLSYCENLLYNPSITCQVFNDLNGNGQFETYEKGLALAKVILEPNAITNVTTETGLVQMFVDVGDYTLRTELESHWDLTTGADKFDINVNSTFEDTFLVGYKSNTTINDLDIIAVANANTRCSEVVPFSINYKNTGTTILNGYITIIDEELIDFIDIIGESSPPDSIEENQLFWRIENLYPGEAGVIKLYYTIADQNFVGDTIVLETKAVFPITPNNNHTYPNPNTNSFEQVKICHCTGSLDQPYIVQEVPLSAIDGEGNNDHALHDCDIINILDLNDDGEIDEKDCEQEKPTYDNLCFSNIYKTIVRCSFDPNDKQVEPIGYGIAHQTLKDQDLIYTIRFQNTGNDTAFHVEITDQLDNNLDINSFQFLAASHEDIAITMLQEDGKNIVVFTFANIILPDSIVDNVGSQGFIMFSIRPTADIADNTVISNNASIVFDRFVNYPIVTNTVMNTLVTEINYPKILVAEDEINFEVYPNPFKNLTSIYLDKKNLDRLIDIYLVSIDGKIVLSYTNIEANKIDLSVPEISQGIYLILLKDSNSLKTLGIKKVVII